MHVIKGWRDPSHKPKEVVIQMFRSFPKIGHLKSFPMSCSLAALAAPPGNFSICGADADNHSSSKFSKQRSAGDADDIEIFPR